jgi:hypothetical protein
VIIDYTKHQSLNGAFMRLVTGNDAYKKQNTSSANATAKLLASYVQEAATGATANGATAASVGDS